MKYLKLYESFNISELRDTLNDILLEIKDIDNMYVREVNLYHEGVDLHKFKVAFDIESLEYIDYREFEITPDIFDIIERCERYVDSIGCRMILIPKIDGDYDIIERCEKLRPYINDYMDVISIIIYDK